MLFRIKREIFKAGEFEQHIFNEKVTKSDLCEMYHLDPATTAFYNNKGEVIDCEMNVLLDEPFVIAVQHPGDVGMIIGVSAIALAATLAVGAAVYAIGVNYWDWKDIFNWYAHERPQTTYAYSLRGSANPRRKGGRIGLLLGRACVTPDQAGLIYSSYNPNNVSQTGSGKQWLHQLFCYGYRDVVVMKDSSFISSGNPNGYMVRIGESPIDIFGGNVHVEINNDNPASPVLVPNFTYYNKRCVEEGLTIRLDGAESDKDEGDASARYAAGVSRTSPTNTKVLRVGVCAPYGWYNQNNNDVIPLRMHYGIDIKAHSSNSWPSTHWVNHDSQEKYNGTYYRAMHEVDPAQWLSSHGAPTDSNNQYDVRVYRYGWDDPSSVVKQDTLMVELMQFDTRNPVNNTSITEQDRITPVRDSNRFGLMGLYAEATDKLNGYINQLNVECFLNTYYFTGNAPSADPSLWRKDVDPSTVGDRNNPACALLYMLISNDANPRSLNIGSTTHGSGASAYYTLSSNATTYPDINKIDWYSLSDWFLFCKSMVDPNVSGDDGWKCNAWVTDELTVGELCSRICLTGRALFKVMDGKFSVLIQRETSNVTQMFTPRNAWDMQEVRSFEKPVSLGKASFIDMDTAEEVERYVLIDSENVISYPDDISEVAPSLTDDAETYELWGVTKPHQVAQLMAFQLLCKRLQTRTYTWKCALESITCAVGDVIYLANDMFLFSLGYGRITKVLRNGNTITGIMVDEAMGIDTTKSYGVSIRKNNGTVTLPLSVSQTASESYKLVFSEAVSASEHDIMEGNLFIYGDQSAGGKKVIITGIAPDQDKGATITAVDYVPEVYTVVSGTAVPDYVSGISVYGSGANISMGVVPPTSYQQGPAGAEGKRGSIWSEGTAINGEPSPTETYTGYAGQENDMYLNTDTGNVYVCVIAGNALTARWRYAMNNTGDDAAYFAIVSSQMSYERNPRNPVPTVLTLTAAVRNVDDYDVTWSTPIEGAVFSSSTGPQVTLTVPYSVTNTVEVDATLSPAVEEPAPVVQTRSLRVLSVNRDAVSDSSDSIDATIFISPISVPTEQIYFGLYSDAEHPYPIIGDSVVAAKGVNAFVNGDYFLCGVTVTDSSVSPAKVYTRGFIYEYLNGEWVHTNATETSERVISAAKDYATLLDSMGEEADTAVFAIIGVFKTLVASSAVIAELFSKAITVGNVIKSANYTEDSQPTPITINGHTYDVFVPRTGFCFGSNGVAKFVDGIANNLTVINAKLKGAQIQEAVIEESTFSGDITSYLLDTVNAPTPGTAIHLEAEGSQSSHDYWASANVKNLILSRAQAAGLSGLFAANNASANFGSLVGTYAGNPVGFLKIGDSDVVVESANVASASTSFLQYSITVPVTGTYRVLVTPRKFAGERYENLDVDPSETELISVEDYEEAYVWHNSRKYVSGSTISATAGSIITFEFMGAGSFTDDLPYGKQWYTVYTDELAAVGSYSCSLTPAGFANPQMFTMSGSKIDWPLYSQSTISLSANSSSLVSLSRAANTDWDVAIGSNLGTNFAFIDFTLPSGINPIDTVHITSVSYDILMPTNDGRGYTHVTSANKTVTRVTLSQTSATFVLADGTVDEAKGPIRGYTINFTPEARSVGIFTRTMEPKAKETPSETRTIGTETNPYDDIWAGTFHGTVDGAISGEATYTPKGTVSSPAITVVPTTTQIRLSADLLSSGILKFDLVQDTDTPTTGGGISSAVAALSGVSAALATNPIFTGTKEVIHVGNSN